MREQRCPRRPWPRIGPIGRISLALPHPDWIGQTVTFTGPEDQLVSLRKAAAGSAIVPWIIDYDRREEDFFH
jgi:hypothetical protein